MINPYTSTTVSNTHQNASVSSSYSTYSYGVKPAMNLKSNVIIAGGKGTKEDPFTIELE